eukprot:614693-Rhodomonas_salina.1
MGVLANVPCALDTNRPQTALYAIPSAMRYQPTIQCYSAMRFGQVPAMPSYPMRARHQPAIPHPRHHPPLAGADSPGLDRSSETLAKGCRRRCTLRLKSRGSF